MSVPQDEVDNDLKRFMYDEPPENIDDLRMVFKNQLVSAGSVETGAQHRGGVKEIRYAVPLKKKLSKSKPKDVRRRRGMVMYGIAFLLLAAVAATLLPFPINLVMAVGCFTPLIISAAIVARRSKTKHGHVGQR